MAKALSKRPAAKKEMTKLVSAQPDISAKGARSVEDEKRTDFGLLPRGFAVVEAMIKEERPMAAAEIGEAVNLNSSTTHRLLQSLTQFGYVSRDSSKRYFPTARALFPLSLYHPLNSLRRAASDELRSLRQKFGMTTALQIFLGYQRIVLEIMLANDSFSPYFQTEVTAPAYATASGKLLLSTLSPEDRRAFLGEEPYRTHGPGTIVTAEELDADLKQVVEKGFSVTRDEMLHGLSGVAVPIKILSGRTIGAVVVSGPSKGFSSESINEIAAALKCSAELFSLASPDIRAVARFLGY